MTEAVLQIENVDKFYGPVDYGVHAVKKISMDVGRGEIIALLGSSGCGKTSILRMIAGFEEVSRGTIRLAGREVQMLPPVRRGVAMAFEGYSLYPTVDVRDNIAFALKSARLPATEVTQRVEEVAEMLEVSDILDRMPNSLSGGQQQRTSLARALIREAELYLLDEPMGQLEPQLRTLLRGRIKHFLKERGMTAILVTHDQTEANALADRIAVMEDGVLQQYASPAGIKDRPANLFTGTFVGEPPMNVIPATAVQDNGALRFALDGGLSLSFHEQAFAPQVRDVVLNRSKVMIGVRPYAVRRAESGSRAEVVTNQWLGDQSHIAANFAGTSLVLVEHSCADLTVGEIILLKLDPSDLHVFDVETGMAISHGRELA